MPPNVLDEAFVAVQVSTQMFCLLKLVFYTSGYMNVSIFHRSNGSNIGTDVCFFRTKI